MKVLIILFSLVLSPLVLAQRYQNLASGIQLESDGEILLDDKMYSIATKGNSQIYYRYQSEKTEPGKKFIEGNTVIEFTFDDINSKKRELKSLMTMMQIKEGFNIEYKNYLNEFPDQGTFCSNFGEKFHCYTIGAYFCSKLYKHFGNETNAFKNRTKIMQCYEKVDFLRMYTTINEDPKSKELKKITEENVEIIKERFADHFGKRKTKQAFTTVDFDLLAADTEDERAEYFVQLIKTLNACESMFQTSKVLRYREFRQGTVPSAGGTTHD